MSSPTRSAELPGWRHAIQSVQSPRAATKESSLASILHPTTRAMISGQHRSHSNRVEEGIHVGRIVVTEYISVDGVVEAPSGTEDFARVGWVDDFRRGPEGDEFKVDETMASDALLLGRVTYDGFAPVWPNVEG